MKGLFMHQYKMDRNDHNKVCSRQGVFCMGEQQRKVWKTYFPPFTLPSEAPNLKDLRQEYSKKSCLPMSGSGLGFSHTEEKGSFVFQFTQRRKWKFGASKLGIHSALCLPLRSIRHHTYKLCAMLSRIRLFATPWTAAWPASLSMGIL